MHVGLCSKQYFYDLPSTIAETRIENQKLLDESKNRLFFLSLERRDQESFFIQLHSSTTVGQSDCYPSNSSYPSPFQVPYQDSINQSVETMPKYHRYPLTKSGPSFIQEPIMLTQNPQRSASLKFPTQVTQLFYQPLHLYKFIKFTP